MLAVELQTIIILCLSLLLSSHLPLTLPFLQCSVSLKLISTEKFKIKKAKQYNIQRRQDQGIPWWSVVKTQHVHCGGPEFDPWSGDQETTSCMAQPKTKTQQLYRAVCPLV